MPVRKLVPPVRSSTQPATSTGTSLARSSAPAPFAPFPWPGGAGRRSGGGMSPSGNFIRALLRRRRHRGPRRVEDVPDATGELARVAGTDGIEAVGDAVARADLDLPVGDSRLEAVERPDRRASDPLADEPVDAAVAGTDEVPGGLHEAHRAAEVSTAGRDRDVLVARLGRVALLLRFGRVRDLRISLADVGGGLAGLADPLDRGDHHRPVGIGTEVRGRPDGLPRLFFLLEQGRDREADRRQDDRRTGDTADRLYPDRERRPAGHRFALEVARRVRPLQPSRYPLLVVSLVSH